MREKIKQYLVVFLTILIVTSTPIAIVVGNTFAAETSKSGDAPTQTWVAEVTQSSDRVSEIRAKNGSTYYATRQWATGSFNSSGGQKWHDITPDFPVSEPAVIENGSYVAVDAGGNLLLYDSQTGNQEWITNNGDAPITTGDGAVYGTDGTPAAWEINSGSQRWNPSIGVATTSKPVYVEGTGTVVYAFDTTASPTHRGLDTQTGNTKWSIGTGGSASQNNNVFESDGSDILISTNATTILRVNADTGSVVWKNTSVTNPPSDDSAIQDTTFLVMQDSNLTAYNADTGSYLWQTDIPGSTQFFDGQVEANSAGAYFAKDDTLYSIDLSDGSEKWNITYNHTIRATAVEGSTLWVTEDTKIHKYETVGPAPTPTPEETELELEVDNWQALNSSQEYNVNFNGNDVTSSSTVTSSNSTIIAVNTSANTLDSFGIVGRVQVTAEYQGENVTENVTTGPRNLTNIGIMPPTQWIPSFLGVDDTTGGHNIGSDMQWLLLIIVVMVAATRFVENPWAGVGTGIMFSVLAWVLEYITLGSVLVTVFSGLLIGAMMARTQMGRGVTRDNEEAARISARGKDQP